MQRTLQKILMIAGIITGLLIPVAATELFLRCFPAKDIHPYLGEHSPLTGFYKPQKRFGMTYQSWEAMCEDNNLNQNTFESLLSTDEKPLWIFSGSSFARFLTFHSKKIIRDRKIAMLHRHGLILPLQMAQVEMLLANGLRPQRIFFVILTLEGASLAKQPLRTRYVNPNGAVAYYPNKAPGVLDRFVKNSRLGLTIWVRSGRAVGTPGFKRRYLYDYVNDQILDDFRQLFEDLLEVTRAAGVEVTIILVPRRSQITKNKGFCYQDEMIPLIESIGFEVIDPRKAFLEAENPQALFIPDGHVSELGDKIIIGKMLEMENHRAGGDK